MKRTMDKGMGMRVLAVLSAVLMADCTPASAQWQTDPALTAAIVAETATLKKLYDERTKAEDSIIASEALVFASMTAVRRVEKKMLDYLKGAQGVMGNIYQARRAADLAAEIPRNVAEVGRAIGGAGPQGTAVTLLVSDRMADATLQVSSLYPLIKKLVTGGRDGASGHGEDTTTVQAELLNSAERYRIADEVVTRLEKTNRDLRILAWEIRTLSWKDLLVRFDPAGWAALMDGRDTARELINDWRRAARR